MNDRNDYEWVLDEYPEYITKEQLYKICKVSKKTAQKYLESGLIPSVCTGKKPESIPSRLRMSLISSTFVTKICFCAK